MTLADLLTFLSAVLALVTMGLILAGALLIFEILRKK